MTWKQSIPVVAARSIAEQYGWDQVVIIARKVDPNGGEHVTTYGRDKANCDVAARCGDFLKYKVMGWVKEQTPLDADGRETPRCKALAASSVRKRIECLLTLVLRTATYWTKSATQLRRWSALHE